MKLSAQEVTERLAACPGWTVEGNAIRKLYTFKSFPDSVARPPKRVLAGPWSVQLGVVPPRATRTSSSALSQTLLCSSFSYCARAAGAARQQPSNSRGMMRNPTGIEGGRRPRKRQCYSLTAHSTTSLGE